MNQQPSSRCNRFMLFFKYVIAGNLNPPCISPVLVETVKLPMDDLSDSVLVRFCW